MGGGILFEIQLIQLFVYLTKKGPQGQEEKSWKWRKWTFIHKCMLFNPYPLPIFPRHNKSRIVHESPKPVTALEFRTQGKHIYLFVVTEACVVSINISGKQDVKVIIIYILQYFHVYFYWNQNNLLSYKIILSVSKYDLHQYFQVDFYRNQNYQLSLFIFLQRIYWI